MSLEKDITQIKEGVVEARGEKKAAAERTKNALSILRKIHKAVAMGDIDDICDKIEKSSLKGDIDDKQQGVLKTACDRRGTLIRSKEENPPTEEPTKEEEQSVEATDESIPVGKKIKEDDDKGKHVMGNKVTNFENPEGIVPENLEIVADKVLELEDILDLKDADTASYEYVYVKNQQVLYKVKS